ncbi:hypothetical protein [Streptomyces sp. NPDC057428]|uniref:hypothetical protein n=1 Tax=Streptomyces sp. NPDC057428 TaxID=3346129 RepID=UPI0036B9656E
MAWAGRRVRLTGERGASYGDVRGGDWAAFLRCTLLPYASPGGSEVGTAVARQELADLRARVEVLEAGTGEPAR